MENSWRPSKDEYYLKIAEEVAKRSPCIRRQYGAIIVKEDTIVSTGYNGPVRGGLNCFEVGCIKDEMNLPHGRAYELCPAVHAEENCVSENSLTFTLNSGIEKVKDVRSKVLSFNLSNFLPEFKKVQKIHKVEKEYLRIVTQRNFELEVSPYHILLIEDKEKILREELAKNVKVGDYLPILINFDIESNPNPLPKVTFNSYKLSPSGIKRFNELMKRKRYSWKKLAKTCKFSIQVIARLKKGEGIRKKNYKKLLKIFPDLKNYFEGLEKKHVKLPGYPTPSFCEIAGYFVGDGSLSRNYIAFHDSNLKCLKYYKKLVKKVFGVEGKIYKSWKGSHNILVVSSHRLWLFFKKLGFGVGKKKKIPKIFHSVNEECLCSFLKGFFDAEGTVGKRSIHVTSSSKSLLETIRLLFLRIGIVSSLYKIKRSKGFKRAHYFSLEISGISLERFKKKVGFNHPIKNEKLKKIRIKYSQQSYPVEWFRIEKKVVNKFPILREKGKRVGIKQLNKILKGIKETPRLQIIRNVLSHLVFLKIKKIEKIKKQIKMIDFYVPFNNNFVANGFLVHNCIINAARSGTSILRGVMYIAGLDRRNNKIVEAIPCDRCKRAIINGGIKRVIMRKENGGIERIGIEKWIREDMWDYLKEFYKVKRERQLKSY